MIERLYTVYDKKAEQCIAGIIRVQNDEVARRHFHDALKNTESPLAQHPEDYDLLYLATIDIREGMITDNTPRTISAGADWIEAAQLKVAK